MRLEHTRTSDGTSVPTEILQRVRAEFLEMPGLRLRRARRYGGYGRSTTYCVTPFSRPWWTPGFSFVRVTSRSCAQSSVVPIDSIQWRAYAVLAVAPNWTRAPKARLPCVNLFLQAQSFRETHLILANRYDCDLERMGWNVWCSCCSHSCR